MKGYQGVAVPYLSLLTPLKSLCVLYILRHTELRQRIRYCAFEAWWHVQYMYLYMHPYRTDILTIQYIR